MPITPKSHEFIEGYIFSEAESTLLEAFAKKKEKFSKTVTVPKSWFGLRATAQEYIMLPEHEQSKLRLELKEILCQMNSTIRAYEYEITFSPYLQYVRINIEGTYIQPVRKMTLEQVEEELGYKIEIVGEN